MSYNNEPAIGSSDVEGQLEGGYAGKASDKPKEEAQPKLDRPEEGIIPAQYRNIVWYSMVGFLMAFLADFAARDAHLAYITNKNTVYEASSCHSYKLLFYTNIIMGAMFALCALNCVIPGIDKMFFGLYWDPKLMPAKRSNASLFMRMMGMMLLGLNIAQCVAPSNPGVGLCALCVSAACGWNFILGSFFGHYTGVRYWKMKFPNPGYSVRLADQFTFGGFVFIALLAVGLERTNFFHGTWKNDAQHGQTMLFYLNCITALMYLPMAIMVSLDGYNLWFWSFHFKKAPFQPRGPVAFFNRNIAMMVMGLSTAALIAPSNTGVGVVNFWVHLMLVFVFAATVVGMHGEVNNKPLWIFWVVNAIVFTVLFAVALKKLDDCDASDSTCGVYAKWTDQPWQTHTETWVGCTQP